MQPPSPFLLGGGFDPPTKFLKRGPGLTGPQLLEGGGVAGKEGVTFSRGGCNFHQKKLKSEIFNGKKSL